MYSGINLFGQSLPASCELRVASCELRVASNYGRAPVRVKYSVHAHTIAYAYKFDKFKIVSTCGVQYKVAVFVFDNRAYALHGFPLHRKRKIGFVIVFLHAGRNLYNARLHFEFGL